MGIEKALQRKNLKTERDERDIKRFIVEYADGSSEIKNKGMFSAMIREDNEDKVKVETVMVNMNGNDVLQLLHSFVLMADSLGMFDKH